MTKDLDAAILDLLQRAAPTWAPLDFSKLTAVEERAVLLLTAAGLIERRLAFELRFSGAPESIEALLAATGESGFRQALEGVIAEAWGLWREAFERRHADPQGPPPVFACFRTQCEEQRLTEHGLQAVTDVEAGQAGEVLDFVKKTGFYGPNSPLALSAPQKYIPGVGRQPVPGRGRLERLEVKRGGPQEVRVANLHEVATPLKGLAELLRGEFARRAAGPAGPAVPEVARGTGGEAAPSWPPMATVEIQAAKFAATEFPVLLLGETGTGKEHLARKIHRASARRAGPFKAVNCAMLPKERIDAALFGHVRGAFTGALQDAPGQIRQAEGGTVFLDEIGELPADCWGNLLRFLQAREIMPVGGQAATTVDVRVLAATNKPERIPPDIWHRFGFHLRLPPLRARRAEIPELARVFFEEAKAKCKGKESLRFPRAEVEQLAAAEYDWPGNIRQLQNAVAGAVALHETGRELTAAEVLAAARQAADLA